MTEKSIGDRHIEEGAPAPKHGADTLDSGTVLGQYRIICLLGRGGMGEVYEVEHQVLRRRYALKLLPATLDWRGVGLERFQREAQVMANLDHPNILKVDDFGETNGRYWLRMELAEGIGSSTFQVVGSTSGRMVSLQDLADARGGKVPQNELLDILKQILVGLEYAHVHGAIHRDLKPANILLFPSPQSPNIPLIKIADFGLVRLVGEEWVRSQAQLSVQRSMSIGDQATVGKAESEGTSTRSLLGTYEYMSPEQKRGEEADARSDLYAVGLMTFKLLTGRNPGTKPPSKIDSDLVPAWDELVESALEENLQERSANSSALRRHLMKVADQMDARLKAAKKREQELEVEAAACRNAELKRMADEAMAIERAAQASLLAEEAMLAQKEKTRREAAEKTKGVAQSRKPSVQRSETSRKIGHKYWVHIGIAAALSGCLASFLRLEFQTSEKNKVNAPKQPIVGETRKIELGGRVAEEAMARERAAEVKRLWSGEWEVSDSEQYPFRKDQETMYGVTIGPSILSSPNVRSGEKRGSTCQGLYVWVDGYKRTFFTTNPGGKSVCLIGDGSGEEEIVSQGKRLLIKWKRMPDGTASNLMQTLLKRWHIDIYFLGEA